MKVWYQLDDNEAAKVEVQDDADVDDLKNAVKDKWGDSLRFGAPKLKVFEFNVSNPNEDPRSLTSLRPGAKLSNLSSPNTEQYPLIVSTPPYPGKPGTLSCGEPEQKRTVTRSTFDMTNLVATPFDVHIPAKPQQPAFVCSQDWWDVEIEILAQLDEEDDECGSNRVPPMAVVRCSRGGKTRALLEIAYMIRKERAACDPIAVLFISFNDFSPLLDEEQTNPLQALFRRIAFAASGARLFGHPNAHVAFNAFRSRNHFFDEKHIIEWLGEHRIVLIIDELNNLSALTKKEHSKGAQEFGNFIKTYFLSTKGRYFIFSSHVLSTVGVFGEFIDPSGGSSRHVTLQELPLVENLSTAMATLNATLNGAREAIYYGLLPGMIYERSRGMPVAGKREAALRRFVREAADETSEFKQIVRSLISGDLRDIPTPLHILLDGCHDRLGENKIRWVPFHFQYVMETMQRCQSNESIRLLATAMATLCRQLHESKELSRDGWEGLFVLFLMARSVASFHDNFLVSKEWFAEGSVSVKYNPYRNSKRSLCHCKNWEQLKEGIGESEEPTISIFYPSHAQFIAYDVVVVYSKGNSIWDHIYGYQLKEGKGCSKQPVEQAFTKSFVIKGSPPSSTTTTSQGWCIPSAEVVDEFFGNSGKHWTPQAWARLHSEGGQKRSTLHFY